MKKQIRKLIHRFENLKFRKKLSVLMLIAGLVPVGFLAFSMQYGMMNQLRKKWDFPITHTSAEVSESFSEIHRKHAVNE